MKRMRRSVLDISHRASSVRVSETITQIFREERDAGSGDLTTGTLPLPSCPECGEPECVSLQEALQQGLIDPVSLPSAILSRRLHYQCLPGGELWICRWSLQQVREKPG